MSDAQLRKDPNIRLRCPHCRHIFPRQDKGRCPGCGEIILIPPAVRKNVESMRDRCIRISRDRRERIAKMQRGGSLLGTRRMRRTLAFVAFVVLGVVLPINYMLHQPGGQSVNLTHKGRTLQTLGVLRTQLECFHRDCGRYPTDHEGLWALELNLGATNWHGPYVTRIPPDLWRHPYFYGCTNETVSLWSAGPDGEPQTADDLQAPPPDYAYVVFSATNIPPPLRGDETYIEIVTTQRAQELMAQVRTNPPAAASEKQ